MKKYKVTETESYRWAGVDKTYIVEANSEEEAIEYIQNDKNWPLDADEEELAYVDDYRGIENVRVKEIKETK
tara:strand:+ start:363 stop:578 length:216 start_codon:yes stop_codon:yes gene_type:complete